MVSASARPKAMVSPAAAAYFAIFGEAFRIVACVALHIFMTLTNAMNRISTLLSI
jgi:hypothetical protein